MGTTADKLAYLKGTKADIRAAMVEKGLDVPESTTFRQYGDLIRTIETIPEKKPLNDMTWAEIRKISDMGLAENYFSVGDRKTIILDGNVSGTLFSNFSIDVFIIGINHNSSVEGNKLIHFQIGKLQDKDAGLCPDNYGSYNGTGFVINQKSNEGSTWEGSYMRNVILGNSGNPGSPPENSLLKSLPSDLTSVMKPVTKYTDNSSTLSTSPDAVTGTIDYLFNLAEFEIMGTRYSANAYEQNSQKQYDFYKAGNSKIKYRHNDTSKSMGWWTRSRINTTNICHVNEKGVIDSYGAIYSRGLAPGFCV